MVRRWMWYATRAPLCKGSWREAPEGLCSTVIQFWKCFGKKAFGNDFAAESSFLTMPWQNGGRTDIVRSDDGHTGKSTITTPQSATLTAPLTQGSPCRVPHRYRTPLPKQLCKFQFLFLLRNDKHFCDWVPVCGCTPIPASHRGASSPQSR